MSEANPYHFVSYTYAISDVLYIVLLVDVDLENISTCIGGGRIQDA
jgi:hypothetical protein